VSAPPSALLFPAFDLHFPTTAKRLSTAAFSTIIWDLHRLVVNPASSSDKVKAAKCWFAARAGKTRRASPITVPPLASQALPARRSAAIAGRRPLKACDVDGRAGQSNAGRWLSERKPSKPYFCPMWPGVESGAPGNWPKCGATPGAKSRVPYPGPQDDLHVSDAPGNRA
jgi:hypothetical protein